MPFTFHLSNTNKSASFDKHASPHYSLFTTKLDHTYFSKFVAIINNEPIKNTWITVWPMWHDLKSPYMCSWIIFAAFVARNIRRSILIFCWDPASHWASADWSVSLRTWRIRSLDSTCRGSPCGRMSDSKSITIRTDSIGETRAHDPPHANDVISTYEIAVLTQHLQMHLVLAGLESQRGDAVRPPVNVRQSYATRRRALRWSGCRGRRGWWCHRGMR